MHLCLVQSTVCMSLLQPQRETYNLFDDVLLLADGASSSQCIASTSSANKRCQCIVSSQTEVQRHVMVHSL